jgi:cation:H+ antiporter
MQCAFLVAMLGVILVAMTTPPVTFFGVHPVSLVLPVAYVYGTRMVARVYSEQMWLPQRTAETREEKPQATRRFAGLGELWTRFAMLAGVVGVAGWLTAKTGIVIAQRSGLSESAVGALFTAVSTSLPELVTCIAAVRQGALTLAVGDIIGGNVFDTLFVSLSDFAYRDGSLLHASGRWGAFARSLPVLLTGILLMGLIRRERSGIANIGFESFFVLVLYLAAAGLMVAT